MLLMPRMAKQGRLLIPHQDCTSMPGKRRACDLLVLLQLVSKLAAQVGGGGTDAGLSFSILSEGHGPCKRRRYERE